MTAQLTAHMLRQVREVFGDSLEIIDALWPIRIQPTPEDVKGAVAKDPDNCVFARTCKRMFGSTALRFWKGCAYADMIEEDGIRKINRFLVTKKVRMQTAAFDRGDPLPIGQAIVLWPPPKHQRLTERRKQARRYRKTDGGKLRMKEGHARSDFRVAERELEKAKDTYKTAQEHEKPRSAKMTAARKQVAAAERKYERAKTKLAAAKQSVEKARAVRKQPTFDLTTRNGAIGNYVFTEARLS